MPVSLPKELDFRRYLGILQRRRYVALGVALAVISLFTWGSFLLPTVYEASSTVFIERSTVIDPLIRGVGVSGSMEDRLRNIRNTITTRNILERVIKKLDLDAGLKKPGQLEDLIDLVRKNLNIVVRSGGRETDLFTISFKGSDPKVVSDFVNTLVSEYVEENVKFRRTDAYGAYEFIQSQLMEYKNKLEESDREIRVFRERNPQIIPQSEATLAGRVEGFQSAKIDTEIRLKELQRRRDNLQRQLSGEKQLTVAFVTREGSPQARLNYLNNQLALLMGKYTESYPEVVKIKAEIEEIRRQLSHTGEASNESTGAETSALNPIYQQLKEEITRTEAEIETLRARVVELSKQQQEAQGILGKMPKEQEVWSKIQRNRSVYQRVYDDLLQKLENARISKDVELQDKAATFKVVDPAIRPHQPAKPDRVKIIIVGILAGIAAGIGAAIGLEFLDHSFKDEKSITEALRLPVLAAIPMTIVDSEVIAEKKRDRKVFAAAAAYLVIIGMVFAMEVLRKFMGIKIIDI